MKFGSVFSGHGQLDFGLCLAGIDHAWFCEADEWRRGILRKRWPGVPVHADVRAVGAGVVDRVDGIVGGFPCKGVSSSGSRSGFDHPETVLWREMARCVRELRPRYVLVENVADLLNLGGGELFGEVLGDLASSGYDAWWDCLPASAFGAPHRRDRVFVVAHSGVGGCESESSEHGTEPPKPVSHADGSGLFVEWGEYEAAVRRWEDVLGRRAPEPFVRGVDAGPAGRVVRSRLSALGDGVQVQAGWFLGRMLMDHAAHLSERKAAAA